LISSLERVASACTAHWIPAFAGIVMLLRRTIDDETFVGATLVVALNLGRHKACPYVFWGMTFLGKDNALPEQSTPQLIIPKCAPSTVDD
jgi:hypothetical protein